MTTFISFSDYRRHAERYGYISTWCAWDETNKRSSEFVTADTENVFREKGLDRTLHADVVVLGLNFGASPAWLERTGGSDSGERLAILRANPEISSG